MPSALINHLEAQISLLKKEGLYKQERVLTSPQQPLVQTEDGTTVLNLCANNYLGLANHPDLIAVAQSTLETSGLGMASVRFICGTQSIHSQLEHRISRFLEKDDAVLYSSCFDANTGLFETLLDENDAILSDALNHASIIDGIRLCKAKRFRYPNNDLKTLESQLQEAQTSRFRLIATDGVFSMDGTLARLPELCELARRYDATLMVDDSHAIGVLGAKGRGTPEHFGVLSQVDLLTGTFGKALGGASGGYVTGNHAMMTWLRQRSRPYLFSNSLAPAIAATSLAALDLLEKKSELLDTLRWNSLYFRKGLASLGFDITPGEHPIVPVMLGDALVAAEMAERLLVEGVYAMSFCYPVVPHGKARIRTQMSAAHTADHLDHALTAFEKVGKDLNLI